MTPSIAIIDDNTLSVISLRSIVQDMFPLCDVLCYPSLEKFLEDCNRSFFHFFVGEDIMLSSAREFDMLKKETIVTCKGPGRIFIEAGYKVLDVTMGESDLAKEIIKLHEMGASPSSRVSSEELSDREKEVLALIVKGYMNKEIADMLCISQPTVNFHRNNICHKLCTRSIGRLTIYAVLSGIVSLEEI